MSLGPGEERVVLRRDGVVYGEAGASVGGWSGRGSQWRRLIIRAMAIPRFTWPGKKSRGEVGWTRRETRRKNEQQPFVLSPGPYDDVCPPHTPQPVPRRQPHAFGFGLGYGVIRYYVGLYLRTYMNLFVYTSRHEVGTYEDFLFSTPTPFFGCQSSVACSSRERVRRFYS